jgi:hypothetical protein
MSAFLFLGAGLLANPVVPKVGDGPSAQDDRWVIVPKPRSELRDAMRVVFDETAQPPFTKRAVGLPGEALPIHVGSVVRSPTFTFERITVDGGRVEITPTSIVVVGGRVEIITRPVP